MERSRGWLLGLAVATVAAAQLGGCHKDNNSNNGGGCDGGVCAGNISAGSSVVSTGFSQPLDAAPSPDGSKVYFVATAPDGNPAVFSAPAAGGAATVIASGEPIGAPVAIAVSSDGSTVYVADPAASSASDLGAILQIPSGGGAATVVAGTADYAPSAITLARVNNADVIYFVGADKADGATGIFSTSSGTVQTVLKGGSLQNPTALAVTTAGTVYYIESSNSDVTGTIQQVTSASASAPIPGLTQELRISFPAGLALSQDESALIVPVRDVASGTQRFARVSLANGSASLLSLGAAFDALGESGGLHRAQNTSAFAFVDLSAGTGGTVYLLQ